MRSQAVGTPSITLPTASANPFQPLSDYLNQRWQQVSKLPLEIGCAPRGKGLVVLVEHAIAVQPNLIKTFGQIKDLMESAPAEVWIAHPEMETPPQKIGVNIFVRVANQVQSYGEDEYDVVPLSQFPGAQFSGFRAFSMADHSALATRLPDASASSEVPHASQRDPKLQVSEARPPEDQAPEAETSLPELTQEPPLDDALGFLGPDLSDPNLSDDVAMDPEMAAAFSPEHLRLEPLPEEEPEEEPEEKSASNSQVESPRRSAKKASASQRSSQYEPLKHEEYDEEEPIREPLHIPKSVWAAGLGLCLMTFVGSFYVASRPCWFRSCPPLALAQQQGQLANDRLQVASTWDDLEQARLELNGAVGELRGVPGWTSYGQQARGLRQRYRKVLKSLTPMQDALKQAELAQEKGQSSLLKTEQWEEVQVHWEAAIAQLKGVAPQSPMYALAQDKLAQYEKNLATVQERLQEEQDGQRLLNEARKLARSGLGKDAEEQDALEFLQRTQVRLQDALYTLRQVPRGTTAHQEAVQLMSRYESELSINEGQQSKEEFIVSSYRDALGSAEAAKVSEIQDRWDDALVQWRSAIASINQIPASSSYFDKAQGLVTEYAYSLQQAEKKAEQFAALRRVEGDLDEICSGSPQVCNYKVTPQLIAVTLTLDYERAVLTAGAVGDEQSRIGALNHVHALETALEETSNEAQIPLELYDPDGILVGMHQPRTSSLGAI